MNDILAAIDTWEQLTESYVTETAFVAFMSPAGDQLAQTLVPGGKAAVCLPVRTLVSQALQLDAASLILAHNHPSGNPQPSQKDIAQTYALERILFNLSITIEDHIILAAGQRFSFRAEGLL